MGQISKRRARWEGLRVISNSDITGSYKAVGNKLANESRAIVIWNNTDAELGFTFDQTVNDQFRLASGGSYSPDTSTNKSHTQDLVIPQGDTLYVRHLGSAPTSGDAQFIVMYAN